MTGNWKSQFFFLRFQKALVSAEKQTNSAGHSVCRKMKWMDVWAFSPGGWKKLYWLLPSNYISTKSGRDAILTPTTVCLILSPPPSNTDILRLFFALLYGGVTHIFFFFLSWGHMEREFFNQYYLGRDDSSDIVFSVSANERDLKSELLFIQR